LQPRKQWDVVSAFTILLDIGLTLDFGWACPEEGEPLVARVTLKGPGVVWLQDSLQDALTQQQMKEDQRRQLAQQLRKIQSDGDNFLCTTVFVGCMLLEFFVF
jgi:hypothetical protein